MGPAAGTTVKRQAATTASLVDTHFDATLRALDAGRQASG